MSRSHIYLSPGLFGFSRLGAYEYFSHVETELRRRFAAAGRAVDLHVVTVHPTASIRSRATLLHHAVEQAGAQDDGPIHLVGHSTGGLDARLVASPTVNLMGRAEPPRWAHRLRSVTTVNTPHYGTPLASFFATLSGQRLLYALSALTIVVLKFGAPPLSLSSSLVAAFAGIERLVGLRLRLVDNVAERLVRTLDSAASPDTSDYLRLLREDQGAILQLTPEAMDLFQAGVEDNPAVHYQCAISYAPGPGVRHWARWLLPPWSNISLPIFATLQRLTALEHPRYPCRPVGQDIDDVLRRAFGFAPTPDANDGVVPVRSQVWGRIAWCGQGDHLDVVGHYGGGAPRDHHDWLGSGAGFGPQDFEALMDALADGMLRAEQRV